MTNSQRLRLQSLSKDQLVKLVEDYKYALDIISEICVRESKGEDAHELFKDVRCHLDVLNIYDLNSEWLSAQIDMERGMLTSEALREMVLGGDNNE